jgi:hypothetical protein
MANMAGDWPAASAAFQQRILKINSGGRRRKTLQRFK